MGAPCRVTFDGKVFFKPDFVKRFLDTLHLEDNVVADSPYLKSIGYDNAFNEGDPLLIREKKEEAKEEGSVGVVGDVEATAKALEEKLNPEFKNTIEDKLSKFDKQIEDKKFPSALEVAEYVLPRSIFNKYKKLYELAARNNITVSNEKLPYGLTASWAFNNIQLNKSVAKYYIKDYNEFAETLNHEIIHGLISRGIRDNYSLNKDLKDVMSQVLDKFDSASDEIKNIISYIQDVSKEFTETDFLGATTEELDSDNLRQTGSLEELITYAFTNKEFADFLDSIPASKEINIKGDSIFQQLKNIIRIYIDNLIGKSTALDEINAIVDKYFDTSFNEKNIAERNEQYEWGLKFKANENVFDKYNNDPKKISEAYHKAKTDGSNPELVKAVDELLGKQPQAAETSIFDDFDSTNKGKSIKSKAEANKAFKEKYGEDAAVAKAISSNFESISKELEEKGIFKIKC